MSRPEFRYALELLSGPLRVGSKKIPLKTGPRNTHPRGGLANLTRSSSMRDFGGTFAEVFLGFCRSSARSSPGIYRTLPAYLAVAVLAECKSFTETFPGFSGKSPGLLQRVHRGLTEPWRFGPGLTRWSYGLLGAGCGCFSEVLPGICGGFTRLYGQEAGSLPDPRIGHLLLLAWGVEAGARVLWRFCEGFPGFLPGFCWRFTGDL